MKKILLIGFMLVSALITDSMAQNKTISGKITDSAGDGLPGANVVLKDTSTGTVTDLEGNYKIEIPTDASTLVFSFIGMESQEVNIGSRTVIDVVLAADATQLTEVVVTGSAVGKSKKTLSFSVGTIGEEMLSAVPAPNIGTGLQGKVAGLRVNRVSGQPGQGAFFQIRSANSISNGQQPLIIVDGVWLNGSTLADINPEDIEKVEVLKGAAGASLYGSQAANGVIQIFTKRGNGVGVGKTTVTYRGEYGISKEVNRYEVNKFTNLTITDPDGPRPQLGNPSADNIYNTPLPNFQDYQDLIFRNGTYYSNYVAVQGNSGQTNFLASAQNLSDNGIIRTGDGYERTTFRVNVDHRLNDRLDISTSTMFSRSKQDLMSTFSNGPSSYIATALILTPIFDLNQVNEEDGSPYDWDIDDTGLATTNFLYDRANTRQTVNRNRLLSSIKLNYDINDWLSANYSASIDKSDNRYEQRLNKGFLSTNIPGFFGTTATAGVARPDGTPSNGGGIFRTARTNESVTSRVNLVAQKKFGDWNTAFRLSYLYENLTTRYNDAIGEDFATANLFSLDNAQNNLFVASEEQQIVANSYFLIADFDYQEKYIFSGLVRREESSLFGPDERGSSYFRASGAYRLTEDFDLGPFDELKIRASIGTAGVRPTFEQRFETVPLQNGSLNLGGTTFGNSALTPAQSTEIELGINANFLGAFNMEISYANIVTEDQILRVPLSGATGGSGIWKNAGTIDADVVEFALGTNLGQLLNLGDLNWNLNITFDKVTQKISKLNVPSYLTGPGLQQSTLFGIEEGRPFGEMVGQVFATDLGQLAGQVNADGTPVDASLYEINNMGFVVLSSIRGTTAEIPYKLVDAAGSPLVQPIGDINPDFRMGFANTLGYKGFTLYTLFDWKKGGDVYNMSKQWMFRDQKHAEVSQFGLPAGFYGSNGLYNVLNSNNYFAEDASFLMLREASLTYEVSKENLSKIFGGALGGVKFSIVGRNLFTITDYTGFHPDVTAAPQGENTLSGRTQNTPGSNANTPNGDPSLFAVDSFSYPVTKTFTGSIQITF